MIFGTSTTDLMDMSLSKFGSWWWTGKPGMCRPGILKNWTWLSDWTNWTRFNIVSFSKSLQISLYDICMWYVYRKKKYIHIFSFLSLFYNDGKCTREHLKNIFGHLIINLVKEGIFLLLMINKKIVACFLLYER